MEGKMKVTAAVLVTLFLGASSAHAGWVPTKRLPKPIDYPLVRPKSQEIHKQGKKQNHPPAAQALLVLAPDTARA
jgi:hypothetical protein